MASSSGEFHAPQSGENIGLYLPRSVENDGTLDAGGDVLMQAYENVTNLGTINAGGDVTLSAYATGSAFAPAGDVQVTNSGDITAGGDVLLRAAFSGSDFGSASAPDLDVGVTNSGQITAGGDVDLIAVINLSEVSASSFAFADVAVINSGTIAAGGNVSLSGAISISSFVADTIDLSASALVINSGSITAGGDVSLVAEASLSDFAGTEISVFPEVEVLNSGTISAGGDVDFIAAVDVSNFSASSSFVSSSAIVTNRGTVIAGGDGFFGSDGDITNSGVISVDGVATLDAAADIDNSGSITAGGDAILRAVNNILDSSGTLAGSIAGADVALSAGGSITAGTVTARDDIAIRAPGPVTTLNLTSGATIGSLGPVDVAGAADELLPGVDLSGHDVDVDGSTIAVNVIRAFGPGSDIRLRAPVTASREDLDFAAGGNVTVESPLAATDVAIDAGGTITTGAITARDDIALRAGDTLNVGTLTSGVAIGGTGPVDTAGAADALLGANLAGHDLFVQGGHVSLTQATANGTGSDLTVRATTGDLSIANGTAGGMITLVKEGTTGILTAGTLLAGTGASLTSTTDIDADRVETVSGDLNFAAGGDVTVHNPLAATDVAIDAGGTITTGAITARDDIALRAGDTLNVGTLTSGIAIGGTGPVDTAGAADALLGATLAGHDLFVQGGTVTLTQAAANGTNSDLTVRATTGGLSVTNGTAGGMIALTKEGTSGILSAGTLSAGTGATLTSATDIDAQTVQTTSGDLAFTAGRDVTVHNPLAADDVAIDAGRNITTGSISARDDIALRAGDSLNVGTLRSGVAVGGTGPVDTAGAADALLDDNLAGNDLFVQGGHVSLADATANGPGSDLTVRATNGDLTIANGAAGGTITLVKEGSAGTLSAGTLMAGTGASLTSSTGIAADNVQSASGDIDFDAMLGVTLGTALAQGGNVNILADDLDILGGITGAQVSITNRSGGNAVTVLGDASAPGAFTLTEAELNRIDAPVVSIDSLGQNLLVGNVAFNNQVGSTRINLLGTGRVDIVGAIDASGVNRTLQIGGNHRRRQPDRPVDAGEHHPDRADELGRRADHPGRRIARPARRQDRCRARRRLSQSARADRGRFAGFDDDCSKRLDRELQFDAVRHPRRLRRPGRDQRRLDHRHLYRLRAVPEHRRTGPSERGQRRQPVHRLVGRRRERLRAVRNDRPGRRGRRGVSRKTDDGFPREQPDQWMPDSYRRRLRWPAWHRSTFSHRRSALAATRR